MARRIRRTLLFSIAGLLAFALIAACITLFVLQSSWFKNKVRLEIISEAEWASGGDVELQSFVFDWRHLTAKADKFVLRGTEPRSDAPLFRAERVIVGLKVLSILSRDVKIRSLRLDKPEVHVIVHPDGSTNIPPPRGNFDSRKLPEQIVDLAIGRFELRDGSLALNAESYPLEMSGEQLNLRANYRGFDHRYAGIISARRLQVASALNLPAQADLDAKFQLARDQARFQQVVISHDNSRVELSGAVNHFVNPEANAEVVARLDASELARLLKYPEVLSGALVLTGNAQYRMHSPAFQGSLQGHDLSYRNKKLLLSKLAIRSEFDIQREGASFSRLSVNAPDGNFSGEASLGHFRELRLNGQLRGLQLREFSSLSSKQLVGWSGIASGPVELEAMLGSVPRNLRLGAKANIVPGTAGIPVSGSVELSYQQNGNTLRLGDSHLALPHSSVDLSGTLGETLRVRLNSNDLHDFQPAFALAYGVEKPFELPISLERGRVSFDGTATGPLRDPNFNGRLSGKQIRYRHSLIDSVEGTIGVSQSLLTFEYVSLKQGASTGTVTGQVGLAKWKLDQNEPMRVHATVANADLQRLLADASAANAPRLGGTVSAALDIGGTIANPMGTGHLSAASVGLYGEQIDRLTTDLAASGNRIVFENGVLHRGKGMAAFHGAFARSGGSWTDGECQIHLDTNAFPLTSLSVISRYEPEFSGMLTVHVNATARASSRALSLESLNGQAQLQDFAIAGVPYGGVFAEAATKNRDLYATFKGNLQEAQLLGTARVALTSDYQTSAAVQFGALHFTTIRAIAPLPQISKLPLQGLLEGNATFNGPLANWRIGKASIQFDTVRISPDVESGDRPTAREQDLTVRNSGPVLLDVENETAVLHTFRLAGKDTKIDATGRLALDKTAAIHASASGTMNLQILRLFDPNLVSSGVSNVGVAISGTLAQPALDGTLTLHDASLSMADFPNGLEHVDGLIRFDRNRATIQRLTALSGGGNIALGGFVTFGNGPLVYRLEASAENVRVRYAGAVSVSFNTELKFTGTAQQSLLSGTLTVTRAAVGGNADLGSLFPALAGAAAPAPSENSLLRGVQLDVRVESAPSLQLSTSLSQDIQAEIDLRLRGAPNRPGVLGRVSMNEGQIQVFGSKYTITRGEIDFTNPAKLDPVLDLVLETQARGVTVNIALNGTLSKLNVSYRSDPPLQSSEIIALLAVGRAPDQSSTFVNSRPTTQSGFLSAGTDSILGQAVSPTSSSLQRFFGVTHLKIDPQLQGIENVPQARLTMEQQISREVTITYVTNLSRTSEQIFRLEWALGRQYSFVAIRDENGLFGVDLQYKRRFK